MSATLSGPRCGLLGLAYWYGVMPLHGIVLRRMLAGIRRLAEADARVARRAKESGTAGQVVTIEPSQHSPRPWTRVH